MSVPVGKISNHRVPNDSRHSEREVCQKNARALETHRRQRGCGAPPMVNPQEALTCAAACPTGQGGRPAASPRPFRAAPRRHRDIAVANDACWTARALAPESAVSTLGECAGATTRTLPAMDWPVEQRLLGTLRRTHAGRPHVQLSRSCALRRWPQPPRRGAPCELVATACCARPGSSSWRSRSSRSADEHGGQSGGEAQLRAQNGWYWSC